jgi:nitroreductase
MADNYLEKRYDEVFGGGKTRVKRVGHPLDDLLNKNRSCRGYNKSFVVTEEMMKRIVSVCNKIPSARNQQVLRFRLVMQGEEAAAVLQNVKMGGALPELHLPFSGTEPEAFVVVCTTEQENAMIDIDLGIAAQSMLLKAVEMGLNGLIIEAFNRPAVKEALHLPLEPLMVIAIGKGIEKFQMLPIDEQEDHKYYRKDGIHYVPKVKMEDLIIK